MQTLGDIIEVHARTTPDRAAITLGDRTLTYDDLNRRTHRAAQVLFSAGIRPGDRVALLAENCIDYAVVCHAAARVGAIFLPLNVRLSAGELGWIIENAEATMVVAEIGYLPTLDLALAGIETRPKVLSLDGDAETDLPSRIGAAPAGPVEVDVDPNAAAMMMYTSGTTGFPKGVLFSHRAYFRLYDGLLQDGDFDTDDVVHLALPMFHNAGLNGALNTALYAGARVVIHRGSFTAPEILSQIEAHGITFGLWVPTNLAILLNDPGIGTYDLSSMRKVFYGGMTIDPGLRARAEAVFDVDFYQVYGSTECGNITILRPEDHKRLPPDVTGRPFGNVGMRVVDEAGRDCGEGGVGEVIVDASKGGMIGYWRNPSATAETLRDGWIYSGDLARIKPGGFIHVVDRKKDMIVSGAENIYPAEVEAVVMRHPDVAEVAVFGVPDATYGETVCATVVTRAGRTLSPDDLDAFCLEHLARYKRPRRWVVAESLPRNAAGKVKKGELRAPYWDSGSADP